MRCDDRLPKTESSENVNPCELFLDQAGKVHRDPDEARLLLVLREENANTMRFGWARGEGARLA